MPKSDPSISHEKLCTICATPRQVLVRCQIDETGKWNFVCPGKCWQSVSGGVEDAKGLEGQYPHYRYGGMWKNKHADGPLNAKKPRKVKERQKHQKAAGSNVAKDEAEIESELSDISDQGGTEIKSDDTEHAVKV